MKKSTLYKISYLVIFALAALVLPLCLMLAPRFFAVKAEASAPVLFTVSDAVKPGETVTVTGNYIFPSDDLKIAYAPNTGESPSAFSENGGGSYKLLPSWYVKSTDSEYGSGIMFVLPEYESVGEYDIWIKNSVGWSNGITLNATRPLYINGEAAYAGQVIEIAGRNFFPSEYGVGSDADSLKSLRVKLVRNETDGIKEEKTTGVKSGVRVGSVDSATGNDIEYSNPYKIAFEVPEVQNYGKYDIFVAADGKDFRPLERAQKLEIVEKKAKNWNETVFGSISAGGHVGNDPLDLGVYWAQDLNYRNVVTVSPNTSQTPMNLGAQTQELSELGGGVIYFPAGEYYLAQNVTNFADNVIWVGAGADKTTLYYVGSGGSVWLRAQGQSNVGFARLKLKRHAVATGSPDFIINMDDSGTPLDCSEKVTENKFVKDVKIEFPIEHTSNVQRGYASYGGLKNFVYKNVDTYGGDCSMRCTFYEYIVLRDVKSVMNGTSTDYGRAIGRYAFLENVSVESQRKGHGISLRDGACVTDCTVAKVGDPSIPDNIGEALLVEPPQGYFSAGSIVSAAARTFTVSKAGGNAVDETTPKAWNDFAVIIVGGKGAGQMRYFEKSPVSANTYRLLENERDFDIIPDSTSKYSILLPMTGLTVYRFKAEDCTKGIYIYSQAYDAVIAECEMKNTEGIAVFSVLNPNGGRVCTDSGIRIVNNTIAGVSPGTDKGGITVRLDTLGGGTAGKDFGAMISSVVIRGNTVTGTKQTAGFTPITQSEQINKRGIAIATEGYAQYSSKGELRFITIEGNAVKDSEYGVYFDSYASGLVVRGNGLENIQNANAIEVAQSKIDALYCVSGKETADGITEITPLVGGKIGADIVMCLSPEVAASGNNVLRLTLNGRTADFGASSLVSLGGGKYKFTVLCAPKDADGKITATELVGKELTKEFTVREVYGGSAGSTDKEKAYFAATVKYFDAAKAFFAGDSVESVVGADKSARIFTESGTLPENAKNPQVSLILETDITVRIYFESEDISGIEAKTDGTQTQIRKSEKNLYYIEVAGIAADKAAQKHTAEIGGKKYEFNVFGYALKTQNENLANLTDALQIYCTAARAVSE